MNTTQAPYVPPPQAVAFVDAVKAFAVFVDAGGMTRDEAASALAFACALLRVTQPDLKMAILRLSLGVLANVMDATPPGGSA